MLQILVIEDQIKLRRNLQQLLELEGYGVVVAATGEEGYYSATTQPFDAIILDLTLPGRDGLEILADLREAGLTSPVLILTARDSVEDRVAGLDASADDYLVLNQAHGERSKWLDFSAACSGGVGRIRFWSGMGRASWLEAWRRAGAEVGRDLPLLAAR